MPRRSPHRSSRRRHSSYPLRRLGGYYRPLYTSYPYYYGSYPYGLYNPYGGVTEYNVYNVENQETQQPEEDTKKNDIFAISGIVVASLIFIVMLALLIAFLSKKQK